MYNVKTYKNGLRLVHNFDDNTQAISVVFYTLVGGANEDESNRGIAHLAEHMFFKGTEKRDTKEISLVFDRLGISNNAYTSNDSTVFLANGMSKDAEIIFDVLSDCFFNSTYAPDMLELEKKAVCSELEMYKDDNRDLVCQKGAEISLQGTPYQYELGGTVESVSKLQQQDLIKFRDTYYKTNRLIISVSGNITQEEVERLIEKYILIYEDKVLEPETFKKEAYNIQLDKRSVYQKRDTDQCYCFVGFKSLNNNNPKLLAYKAMSVVWGNIMSSRLFQKVREEKGLVYAIHSYNEIYSKAGLNGIIFYSNINNAEEVLKTIRQAIDEATTDGFTQVELDTAKNVLKTNYTLSNITPSAKARTGARSLAYDGKTFDIEERFKEIDALSLDDINEVFREFVNLDDLTVAVVSGEDIDALSILLNK